MQLSVLTQGRTGRKRAMTGKDCLLIFRGIIKNSSLSLIERAREEEGKGVAVGSESLTQIIPMVIFLALLVVLVLTFITYSIPEFPGALGSSILIVTLIIYGAATLLKA